ncbi:methylase, partial [Klebsiella pneumoniae]|nr:methylase [Klebsiella pneumoniae]
LWTQEAEVLRQKVDTETLRLATGLLLPIWSALPSDHLAVNRIVDGEGRSWLGRLVFDDHVLRLFSALGIDRKETLP